MNECLLKVTLAEKPGVKLDCFRTVIVKVKKQTEIIRCINDD